jgi:hypothetical protein
MTATNTSNDYDLLETPEITTQQRNPVVGLMGFMAAFSGAGAAYVAATRDDVGVIAQMGVVAAVCGGIALAVARQDR